MRWLLRRSGGESLIGGASKLGFNEFRRTVVSSCRAVLLPRFGGAEALELREDVKIPDLKPNEVLVRARAVSINPLDCRVSSRYLVICMQIFWNAFRFVFQFLIEFKCALNCRNAHGIASVNFQQLIAKEAFFS